MKALLITPYYNCVTECILLYFQDKIDALVFIEVDSITVSKMVEKYHLTNILCFSYEEYLLQQDIAIIDTNFLNLNITLDIIILHETDLLSFSTSYNKKYKRNISTVLNKKNINLDLINLNDRKEIKKHFFIFNNIQDVYTYYIHYDRKKEIPDIYYIDQYCYYLSWCKYFLDDKIVYTNHTILLNIVYSFLSTNIKKYIYERVAKIL